MKYKEYLLKILIFPHVSEKSSIFVEKNNVVVFRVLKYANKIDIKFAVQHFFLVKVRSVRTLIIKGKVKRYKGCIGYRNSYKKAYVLLEHGEKIDSLHQINN